MVVLLWSEQPVDTSPDGGYRHMGCFLRSTNTSSTSVRLQFTEPALDDPHHIMNLTALPTHPECIIGAGGTRGGSLEGRFCGWPRVGNFGWPGGHGNPGGGLLHVYRCDDGTLLETWMKEPGNMPTFASRVVLQLLDVVVQESTAIVSLSMLSGRRFDCEVPADADVADVINKAQDGLCIPQGHEVCVDVCCAGNVLSCETPIAAVGDVAS